MFRLLQNQQYVRKIGNGYNSTCLQPSVKMHQYKCCFFCAKQTWIAWILLTCVKIGKSCCLYLHIHSVKIHAISVLLMQLQYSVLNARMQSHDNDLVSGVVPLLKSRRYQQNIIRFACNCSMLISSPSRAKDCRLAFYSCCFFVHLLTQQIFLVSLTLLNTIY